MSTALPFTAPLNGINIASRRRFIVYSRDRGLLSEHATRYGAVRACRSAKQGAGNFEARRGIALYRFQDNHWGRQPLPASTNGLLALFSSEF